MDLSKKITLIRDWIETILNRSHTSDTAGPAPPGEELPPDYPLHYIKRVEAGGVAYQLRPISPFDDEKMLRLFDTFSEETIFHRFFTHMKMSPVRVKRFTHIDYQKQMAIVAEAGDGVGKYLSGVARYSAPQFPGREAELAIVIGDPWQGKGLGTMLLEYILDIAKKEGFSMLYGFVMFDNDAVHGMIKKIKYPFRKIDTGTELKYRICLDDEPESSLSTDEKDVIF